MTLRRNLLLAVSLALMWYGGFLFGHNVFARPSQCVERADGR